MGCFSCLLGLLYSLYVIEFAELLVSSFSGQVDSLILFHRMKGNADNGAFA